jgi:Yip1 domain
MSESVLVQDGAASSPAGLSQVERVVDAYIAPSKTFEDIKRDASWWFPFLLTAFLAVIFSYVVLNKIGLPTLVDGIVHQTPSLEDRLANSTPEQAAGIRRGIEVQFKFMYVSPVIFIVVGAIVAAIFLATANFAFGGRATYKQMLAVWFYGTLPLAFASILTMVTVFAGVAGDSFNIKNTIGTNIGYYLMSGDSPKWLVTLLSSVDVLAIWAALLLTIGISIVAGIKRSSAAVVVFGWWALYVLCQTGIAAFAG